MSEVSKKVIFLFSGFAFILAGGTLGYMYLEEYPFTDALYLTIITAATLALISVVSSNADNVFITLTAKGINPKIMVLARSSGEKGQKKN